MQGVPFWFYFLSLWWWIFLTFGATDTILVFLVCLWSHNVICQSCHRVERTLACGQMSLAQLHPCLCSKLWLWEILLHLKSLTHKVGKWWSTPPSYWGTYCLLEFKILLNSVGVYTVSPRVPCVPHPQWKIQTVGSNCQASHSCWWGYG